MGYREHLPPAALRPFVDRFWTRAGGDGGAGEYRVLPDGCVDLLIHGESGAAFAVGTMTRPLVMAAETGALATMVAVRFRPGAAGAFLRVAAPELTDRRVAVQELGVRWLAPALDGHTVGERGAAAMLRALERALVRRLPTVPSPDGLVARAVAALLNPAPPSVAALAGSLGVSRQHLGRRVRAEVGVGPKELARVARVHRAVAALQGGGGTGLAGAAAEVGYFDQAHMDRDFRQLVGVTPGAVLKAPAGSIRPIASLFGRA